MITPAIPSWMAISIEKHRWRVSFAQSRCITNDCFLNSIKLSVINPMQMKVCAADLQRLTQTSVCACLQLATIRSESRLKHLLQRLPSYCPESLVSRSLSSPDLCLHRKSSAAASCSSLGVCGFTCLVVRASTLFQSTSNMQLHPASN